MNTFTEADLRASGFEKGEDGRWRKAGRPTKALSRPDAKREAIEPSKAPAGRISAENDPLHGANKLERRYAEHLAALKDDDAITRWDYEPERLKLADGSWYLPDFRVVLPDGSIEFHETKGFWREAARVRIKVAAALHPYRFRAVRLEHGEWEYEDFGV